MGGGKMDSAAAEVTGGIERSGRKRKKLTAQEKWQIFLETSVKDAPVGEILRRYGLYSSELTKPNMDYHLVISQRL
jgi:hypothetical protein